MLSPNQRGVLGRNPVFHQEERLAENYFRIQVREGGPYYILRLNPFGVFEVSGGPVDSAVLALMAAESKTTQPFTYFQPLMILTNHCNLACTYCYAFEGSYGLPVTDMRPEVVDASLRFLHDTIDQRFAPSTEADAAYTLGLICFGGEPLLALPLVERAYDGLSAICVGLSRRWQRTFRPLVTLNTNAYEVTPNAARLLLRMKQDLELVVSFDGWLHDTSRRTKRGGASSERVLSNLFDLHEAGLDVSVTSCVLPEAVDNPEATLDSLSEIYRSGIPVNLSFIRGPLAPVEGRAAYPGIVQGFYTRDALDRFGELVAAEIRSGAPIFSHRYRRRLYEGGYEVRCAAGLYEFSVMPDGTVYPCHNFVAPGHSLGNILDSDFRIDPSSPLVSALSDRLAKRLSPCRDCVLQSTCMSSFDCPAHSLQDLGDLDRVDDRFCGFARRVQGAILGDFIEECARA